VTGLLATLGAVSREPPEVVIIGAEVGEIRTFAPELSPPLRAAVPVVVRLVLRECDVVSRGPEAPPTD
jgi:hypothetical protein